MKSTRTRVLVLIALLALIAAGLACAILTRREPEPVWTPPPVGRSTAQSTRPGGAILPSLTLQATIPRTATPTRPVQPIPTPAATQPQPTPAAGQPQPTVAARPAPAASATSDPHLITITEADVARAVASDAAAESGLVSEELAVRFTEGKIHVTADKLAYGPIQVQNLILVGRLAAKDGRLQLETESISPRGLVSALIPTVANQALAQLASQWYVEEVRILDGRLEVRIR